jgi:dihydropteroate synthase
MTPNPPTGAYLCPHAFVSGRAARDALAAGLVLPLHGRGDLAFALIAASVPPRSELVPAADLRAWIEVQDERWRERLRHLMMGLTSPVAVPSPRGRPPPLVMGIVNVTPDSFSDGGRYLQRDAAIAHGRQLWHEGADWIDVGGESTRPGAGEVPLEEEIRRVVPVVRALAEEGIAVSIDTRKAGVMQAALEAGAGMINDVSALRFDPRSAAVARASHVPIVLMHSRGLPATMQQQAHYTAAANEVFDALSDHIAWAESLGIPRARLLVDPGIGFAKTLPHNLDILHALGLYACLGIPVLIGVSRKSFIGQLACDAPPTDRLPGSLAAAQIAVFHGSFMMRVHDVAATRQALAVSWAVGS